MSIRGVDLPNLLRTTAQLTTYNVICRRSLQDFVNIRKQQDSPLNVQKFTSSHSVRQSSFLTTSRSPVSSNLRYHSTSQSDDPKEQTPTEIKMSKPNISEGLKRSKAESLWGLFISDALSMPVHWYYNPVDIVTGYNGWISEYVAPNKRHPSSILKLSAVDGSGRGSSDSSKSLIGHIILHDKLKYWQGSGKSNHYHQGMSAGDNTLNAVMALHEIQTMNKCDHDLIKPDREVRASVLADYVSFMTTPNSHNDTYAESFHRAFFRDWVTDGKPTSVSKIIEFAETRSKKMLLNRPDSQLAVIGSLVPAIPWIIRTAHKSEKECAQTTVDFIKLTHPVPSLIQFVDVYARLLHAVINGKDLKSEVLKVLSHSMLGGPGKRDSILKLLDDSEGIPRKTEARLELYQTVTSRLGSACYIEGAFSSMLFLALEFHDDFEGGVLANANCGGENCHRGAALGALLAANSLNHGSEVPDKFKQGLGCLRENIETAIYSMNDGF